MFKYSMDYGSTKVTVSDEISHLEQFLQIQGMRFPGKYAFVQVLDCPYETLYRVSIPKLTLQPIVENAISHGLRQRPTGGKITIRCILSDREFCIIISDNGMGIPEDMVVALNRSFRSNDTGAERQEASTFGIALTNIDMRIKFYCGEAYGLHIASTPGLGTDVTIHLPAPETEA
jgi:two-component system sensor histidine kinase YesM